MAKGAQDYRQASNGATTSILPTLSEAAGALGIDLSAGQLGQFQRYRELLADWNQRINLTSISDPAEVERRHFLDSLTCLLGESRLLRQPGCRAIDVGSGAGFPGVPLKIVLPNLRLTLLEARGKRAEFLSALIGELDLEGVEIIAERAEVLAHQPPHREAYDIALARALGELAVVLELCLPFVRPGGALIAPRRGDLPAEQHAADAALAELGGHWEPIIPVQIPGLANGRGLVIVRKIRATPSKYPRRPGIPAKRPLTSAPSPQAGRAVRPVGLRCVGGVESHPPRASSRLPEAGERGIEGAVGSHPGLAPPGQDGVI